MVSSIELNIPPVTVRQPTPYLDHKGSPFVAHDFVAPGS